MDEKKMKRREELIKLIKWWGCKYPEVTREDEELNNKYIEELNEINNSEIWEDIKDHTYDIWK